MDNVDMCMTSLLQIDLKALNEGDNSFVCELDDAYFQAIEASDVRRGNLKLTMSIRRVESYFDLNFHIVGVVYVPCDLCLEDMEQPVTADSKMAVKFGEAYSEDGDTITVSEEEGILDAAWLVYECIALNIPIKHVHAPGKCDPAMIEKLNEFSAVRGGEEEKAEIDPRWAKLQVLKDKD